MSLSSSEVLSEKSDVSKDTDDMSHDASDFLVRCSDGHVLADICRQKTSSEEIGACSLGLHLFGM